MSREFLKGILALLFALISFLPNAYAWDPQISEWSERKSSPQQEAEEIRFSELPAPAKEVIALIESGGPFRFRKDGSVFGNYDGHLPRRPRGYYREYTAQYASRKGRGAKRIISGRGGEFYYTSDHYDSFRRIIMDTDERRTQ